MGPPPRPHRPLQSQRTSNTSKFSVADHERKRRRTDSTSKAHPHLSQYQSFAADAFKSVSSSSRQFEQQERKYFKAGKICWITHHDTYTENRPNIAVTTSPGHSMMSVDRKSQSRVSFTNGGTPVYTKPRPFIIIAAHADHYSALPMYTHQDNGMSRVGNQEEHAYVRDHRRGYPPDISFQPSYHVILETEGIPGNERFYSDNSTVHFTQTFSKRYNVGVSPAGRLTKESTKDLLKMVFQYQARAFEASLKECEGK